MSLTTLPAPLPWVLPASGAAATGLFVQIAGVPVIVRPRSLQIVDAIGQRSTASFAVQDYTGVSHYRDRQPVSMQDGSGFTLYAGVIASATRTAPAAISSQLDHVLVCSDWHYLADKKIFAGSYVNQTCGFIVQDVLTQKLAVEGIFAANIQAGPLVTSYVANYKTATTILDDLAQLAGFYWYIDRGKGLHFSAPGTTFAPFAFDGTQALDDTGAVEDTSPLYRNAQYVLGGLDVTVPQTETQKGDGSKRVFSTSFPIHSVPTNIHIDAGAAQTIGILGVDAAGTKQWYWNKGIAQITQDSTGTVLSTANVLSITYVGEFPVIAYVTDAAAQSSELAREGGVGTGINEDVVADASIVTSAQAFQQGTALLGKYTVNGQILLFRTTKPGLAPGQMLNVNLPPNWDYAGVQALIESVTTTFDDFRYYWDVKALLGPANTTWVQFYQALASQQSAVDHAVAQGQSSTVALLNSASATWPWAATDTQTVTACPVFPMTFPFTLC